MNGLALARPLDQVAKQQKTVSRSAVHTAIYNLVQVVSIREPNNRSRIQDIELYEGTTQ